MKSLLSALLWSSVDPCQGASNPTVAGSNPAGGAALIKDSLPPREWSQTDGVSRRSGGVGVLPGRDVHVHVEPETDGPRFQALANNVRVHPGSEQMRCVKPMSLGSARRLGQGQRTGERRMTGLLSAAGLAKLHDLMAAHVAEERMPGLVTLVAGGGEVHVDVIGRPSFTDAKPVARDAIFRIASLTKPITAATTMSLVDAGVLSLDQPVDDLLPELADRRVLCSMDAELTGTVPARRSITVEDLLSLRMGFGSVMAPPGTYPIQRAEAELGLQSIGGPPWPPVALDTDQWIAALGTLPLLDQPGERWLYNTGAQVLGVLLARVAQKDLDAVMRERIFKPLRMTDTGFTVPGDKLNRLTTFYMPNTGTGELSMLDDPIDSWWGNPTRFADASGWLTSTIDDYWAFVSMLLAGGSLNGQRVLSESSVEVMTTDRLTPEQRAGTGVFLGDHTGWGFGMAAPADGSRGQPLPCGFGWDGGSGTTWRTNAETGTTGILLTQRAVTSPGPQPVYEDFWAGVNAATNVES